MSEMPLSSLSENPYPQELPAGYKIDERDPSNIFLYDPSGKKIGIYHSHSEQIIQDAIGHAQRSQEPAFNNE